MAALKGVHPACVAMGMTRFASPEGLEHCLKFGADYFFDKSREFERVPEVLAALRPTKGGHASTKPNQNL